MRLLLFLEDYRWRHTLRLELMSLAIEKNRCVAMRLLLFLEDCRWRRTLRRLRGVKPVGKHQWKFKCFWLYGAVSPSTGRSFFWEFSHLDKICFQAYLEQLSLEYPDELHIIQVDNAGGHLLSKSELPDNIILLFQPPHCPEVNPTERVWEYIKEFLAWFVFSNLDELRVKVQEILASLTNHVISFLTG